MGSIPDGALRLTTGYHEIRGRAAEIARGRGSWIILAEHFFLGMLHDGGGRCMKALSQSADLDEAESAVLTILDDPGYALPPSPGRPVPMIQNGIWGMEAAVRMDRAIISVDHAFLDLIRQRDTVPARALAHLGLDLDAVDAAVVGAMTAADPVPQDAVFLPDGQEFDDSLKRALRGAVPRGAGLSMNPYGDRPWLKVSGPYDTTEILNAALAALGRPTLS
jgi:Clp amino terminal domain, pathogenicity island component